MSKTKGTHYMVARLAAHNAKFDQERLRKMYGTQFLPAHPLVLDTLQLALWSFQGKTPQPEKFTLSVLLNYLGIPIPDAHDALADVRGSIALAKALYVQMNCTFDSIKHLYCVDGRPVPSCTQVLSAVGILPSFSMVDKVLLERKRQIGVALHAALHYLQQGDLDESTVDERVKPRLDAYRLFVADTGFNPIDCELRCGRR